MGFAFLEENRVKRNESKYFTLARELRKNDYMSNGDINCSWCPWNDSKTWGNENQRKNRNHLAYNNDKIGLNTRKSPENFLSFKIVLKITIVSKIHKKTNNNKYDNNMLVMKSGKRHLTDGIELPNPDKIRTIEENETYKYLGILKADTIKYVEMKDKIQNEYQGRTWKLSKFGDCYRGWPEGSLFNSYYTEVYGRALILSLDCSTLPLIRTLYCWVLSNEVSSTIFKVFGMT